jgi:hypothetical protein
MTPAPDPTSDPDPDADLVRLWGQRVWLPLFWRIATRWGEDSAVARAVKAWLSGHVRSMEAQGLTGLSLENIDAGIRAAESEGQRLLGQLETAFPIGTGPVSDAEAQEAVARIVDQLRGQSAQS